MKKSMEGSDCPNLEMLRSSKPHENRYKGKGQNVKNGETGQNSKQDKAKPS